MNIPQVPSAEWTRPFLNQLRDIANTIEPGTTAADRKEHLEIWRSLTEDQLDVFFDATRNSFHEFERVEQIMRDDHRKPPWSPGKWVDYLIASQRHEMFGVETMRRLFGRCTPGVHPETIKQLELL